MGTAFTVVTLWRLFSDSSFSGLLQSSDGSLSPGRIQLLVLTIIAALQYLLMTLQDPHHLPALPSNLVTALGGSQVVYLGSKAWTSFQTNGNTLEKQ
jgi:hypothetical protein